MSWAGFLGFLSPKGWIYLGSYAVLVIIGVAWAIYEGCHRRKLRKDPWILERLERLHQTGANYEEMVQFLEQNGIAHTIADDLILGLEHDDNSDVST